MLSRFIAFHRAFSALIGVVRGVSVQLLFQRHVCEFRALIVKHAPSRVNLTRTVQSN